ncbi:MAG: protein O-mannosyl-transferase, partial [Acidobacteriota bacterium]|nr:protein O-mannosyl-transferase [Acidobacteriota bacterium]
VERRAWRAAITDALPSLVAGAIALVLLNRMNAPEWTSGGGSAWQYAITQPFVWMHYARLAILPVGLTADTDLEPFRHWYATEVLAGFVFVAVLLYAIVRLARESKTAPAAFGLAFFVITLLPTSLFPLAEVANEHRLFFPLMGFAIAAVCLLTPRRGGWAVLAVAIVAMAVGTHARNRIWATEETLWRDVTEKSPRNGRAWMNYGLTQMAQGKLTDAKGLFERAAQYTPNYSTLEINRGIVAGTLGEQTEAEGHFKRALTLSADRSSHFFYGRWLLERGRAAAAYQQLELAARMAPSWSQPQELLHTIAIARGQAAPALTCGSYERCLAEGLASTGRGKHLAAATAYRAALHYRQHPDAWNNLGWSLQSLGFRAEARAAYEQALRMDPAYERAKNNLRSLV